MKGEVREGAESKMAESRRRRRVRRAYYHACICPLLGVGWQPSERQARTKTALWSTHPPARPPPARPPAGTKREERYRDHDHDHDHDHAHDHDHDHDHEQEQEQEREREREREQEREQRGRAARSRVTGSAGGRVDGWTGAVGGRGRAAACTRQQHGAYGLCVGNVWECGGLRGNAGVVCRSRYKKQVVVAGFFFGHDAIPTLTDGVSLAAPSGRAGVTAGLNTLCKTRCTPCCTPCCAAACAA